MDAPDVLAALQQTPPETGVGRKVENHGQRLLAGAVGRGVARSRGGGV